MSGHAPFETTAVFDNDGRFERTERIPVERIHGQDEYVRDSDEWIARCVRRVLELDPLLKADEANRSVTDLAALERWRMMKPEAAAEQLYSPITIKPHPACPAAAAANRSSARRGRPRARGVQGGRGVSLESRSSRKRHR
jgi:hypothetical protein